MKPCHETKQPREQLFAGLLVRSLKLQAVKVGSVDGTKINPSRVVPMIYFARDQLTFDTSAATARLCGSSVVDDRHSSESRDTMANTFGAHVK